MKLVKSILIVSLIIIGLSIGGITLFWLADVIPALKAIIPLAAFNIAVFQIFDSIREYKNNKKTKEYKDGYLQWNFYRNLKSR